MSMSTAWKWPGSRWWRVDLHTHSPASYDFKPEQDREQRDWSAWVAAAKGAGLDAVALTDHNTPDGIAGIQATADAGLVVFPGVEVTVGGIHLLCVLDEARDHTNVIALLANLGIQPSAYGRQDTASPKGVTEAIGIASDIGAIVIAAHVNGLNGLLGLQPGERLKALKEPKLAAAEVAAKGESSSDPDSDDVQKWLDGSLTGGQVLTQVWSSDSHRHVEAGRRFTWVKMTRPSLEGLRLALLDGKGSLKPATKDEPGDPNRHADMVVESITVTSAKYMGRPSALVVQLNPWLNAIIGGRGTGKSTLVDLCRLGLRRESELGPPEDETSLRKAFENRMRVPQSRSEEGLLTSETRIEIVYRKDGGRFRVAWDRHGTSAPITRLGDGEDGVAEDGDIRERFPIRIYSQKQLFELASRPDALFHVIDEHSSVRFGEYERLSNEAKVKYLSLCAEARALRTQAADLPSRKATLEDIRRKIEVLQRGGHATALHQYKLRRTQDTIWASIQTSANGAIGAVEKSAEALIIADLGRGLDVNADAAMGSLVAAHGRSRTAIERLQAAVQNAVATARGELAAIHDGEDASRWRQAVDQSAQEYKAVVAQLAAAGIANPDEYGNLLQLAATLEQDIVSLEQRRGAADEREKEAAAELDRYRSFRLELTNLRKLFTGKPSELVRIEIHGFGAPENLESSLREILGIRAFDSDYQELVDRIRPNGHEWDFAELDGVVRELRELRADPRKQWAQKDKRFETALRKLQPEQLDRLALYAPADGIEVSFRDPRDKNKNWRDLAQGSPGQKTAALLAFVLGYGNEPIILDQPEDDLDNTLIYDLLVERLREIKKTRQVIVVTHNPNIVVHGDAELIVWLEQNKGATLVGHAGLQEKEAREKICDLMEGGYDAFRTRYRRIMPSGNAS